MKIRSALLTAGSGSIGGATLSHNKGGMYLRARAVPTNPNTARQTAVRSALAALSIRWSTILSAAQREAWNLYAANVPVTNLLGESINLSGQQMYIRSNVPALQAGLSSIDSGPTEFNLGDYTQPSIDSTNAAGGTIDISFDDNDAWVGEAGAYMLLYGGKPQGVGRNFFKGPFRYLGKITGDDVAPPAPPETVSSAYTLSIGNLLWVRAQVIRVDGRLSTPTILGPATIT